MQTTLIVLSDILVFASYVIYEWSMVKGKSRPHRTAKLVGFLINVLCFFSLYAQGDRVIIWFLGVCTIHSLIVFLMSFKFGMGGRSKTDMICLGFALLGIVLWRITSNPALALYCVVAADLSGMIPALIKTYRLPHTEYWLSYIIDVPAVVLTILAIRQGGFNEYLYPSYLLVVSFIQISFIFRYQLIPKSA